MASAHDLFRSGRDALLATATDYDRALATYEPPRPAAFNWALDWFDVVAATPGTAERTALRVIGDDGSDESVTFAQMSARSTEVAAWLRAHGVERGHRVLLMLGNQVELWETMLACMKLGAVLIPATTLLTAADITDRVQRGRVSHVVTGPASTSAFEQVPGDYRRIVVGGSVPGWTDYPAAGRADADGPLDLTLEQGVDPRGRHAAAVLHVGDDRQAQAGRAHARVLPRRAPVDDVLGRPAPRRRAPQHLLPRVGQARVELVLRALERRGDDPRGQPGPLRRGAGCWRRWPRPGRPRSARRPRSTACSIQQDLRAWRDRLSLREMVGAGEPLNPEVIAQVRDGLGLTIRDGFGQTETTLQVGNSPGQEVVPGSMGRVMPGYDVVLLDPATGEERTGAGAEGELCLRLSGPGGRPVGLMVGYHERPRAQRRGHARRRLPHR